MTSNDAQGDEIKKSLTCVFLLKLWGLAIRHYALRAVKLHFLTKTPKYYIFI